MPTGRPPSVRRGSDRALTQFETASEEPGALPRAIEQVRRTRGDEAVVALALELRARAEFDLMPIATQEALDPNPCYQTYRVNGGLMYTVTILRIPRASAERVRRALIDIPWRWWAGGHVDGWTKRPDGSVSFVLWPTWLPSPASFRIELGPVRTVTETAPSGRSRQKLVTDSRFSGNFEGAGRYEMIDVPGGVVLRSVFDGVRRLGFMRLFPSTVALQLHVRAERGALPFPLPRGTGFVGIANEAGLVSAD